MSSILVLIPILVYIFYLYFISGWVILVIYIVWSLFLIVFMGTLSFVFSKGVHFHHYLIALLIMSYCGHHNVVTSCLHGLMNGMFVEGCARWSMAPIWEF